jgi:hypothetical protein
MSLLKFNGEGNNFVKEFSAQNKLERLKHYGSNFVKVVSALSLGFTLDAIRPQIVLAEQFQKTRGRYHYYEVCYYCPDEPEFQIGTSVRNQIKELEAYIHNYRIIYESRSKRPSDDIMYSERMKEKNERLRKLYRQLNQPKTPWKK